MKIKNQAILFLLLILTTCIRPSQPPFEPVNKNASPEARALLKYLYSVSGKKIISGHHNGSRNMDRWHKSVEDLTGRSPAIWGSDFINYCQEWEALTTPGTALHDKWVSRVDTIAGYLKQLRDLNIPVLWRPYHEMNGIWFWWGDKKGADGFARLWKMMFDRFVNHHGLNNLIWVWNTNAPRDRENDEAYAYEWYSPGLAYVDVLAADVYHNDYRQEHHDQLVALVQGKVISLGEVGEVPTPEILDNQPMWTWFMIWSRWVETHNTPEKIKDLYDYHRTLSHGEIELYQ